MFTFLSCFMFVTVAFSLACNKDCWFQKKTRGAKDLCYGDVRPLATLLARVLGVAPGWDVRAWSIGGPLKKRMIDTHLSCLAAIPKILWESHGNSTVFMMNGVKRSRVTAQDASSATSAEHVTTEKLRPTKGWVYWLVFIQASLQGDECVATVYCHQWLIRLKHN